ncbi:phenylalanine 4-monooxygenase [Siphonobacter aquaeclarae]|uniref:Phenylalanine 4-hydroxylase n=1 Tax=Siphonobacter aquaeclarae TaxID=563176 RepID=A0A1G9V0N2_9BACT|nr:phenylalanine 4-monooxygenase [Siphonobacter aquaeclarae]SDM65566.1 Phenylalanine 4-hydroxylase [Siphonobacter aquaeclarae]
MSSPYAFVPYSLKQEYARYTSDDQDVWKILFERQLALLPGRASEAYFEGLRLTGLTAEAIPRYEEVSDRLRELTGWAIHVVPGLIANRPFFELMRDKQFCASTWLRSREQLDYLEEPDMFHDIFGHVPMLSKKAVCHFLEELARIALRFVDIPEAIEYIARLYWYTIEFGLVREKGELRIYGAGILSSTGESQYCLGGSVATFPYDIRMIFQTPYIKEHYQDQYFVIDSYDQLFHSIPAIETELEHLLGAAVVLAH